LNENSRAYSQYLTAFADAKQWDWDPNDEVVAKVFNETIDRMLKEEAIVQNEAYGHGSGSAD
jgi:hypothetical protein